MSFVVSSDSRLDLLTAGARRGHRRGFLRLRLTANDTGRQVYSLAESCVGTTLWVVGSADVTHSEHGNCRPMPALLLKVRPSCLSTDPELQRPRRRLGSRCRFTCGEVRGGAPDGSGAVAERARPVGPSLAGGGRQWKPHRIAGNHRSKCGHRLVLDGLR